MSPLTPDRTPPKGRAAPWRTEPHPHAGVYVSDEEIDTLFAKVTSERPPPVSVSGDDQPSFTDTLPDTDRQDIVDFEDIDGANERKTQPSSDRPDARQTLLPRPRMTTLLGMAPP